MRLNAVKSLGDCISKKLDDGEHIDQMELEFSKNALLDRLVDDDEAVVSEVLTFSSILKLAKPDQLIQNLREVSQKFPNLKQTLALTCIKEFSDIDLNLANDLCDLVFDNLLHTDEVCFFFGPFPCTNHGVGFRLLIFSKKLFSCQKELSIMVIIY